MSNTVDNRIVNMQFNNKQFESGIHQSMLSLDRFKQALSFKGADQGISNLQKSVSKLDFRGVERAIMSLEQRFSTFGIVGMTAIQNITNRVTDLGFNIAHKLTDQIKQGGKARYQNIAQAKFQIEGLGASWEKLYEDMDYAVDGTAYGIDEAAKVASSLSASGIEAGEGMKKYLRAVSGVAAMTNSTYSEIGDIFTTVAGNGKLMSMQMNQLSFRGLNVAAKLGEQLGYTEGEIREMVTRGEIDFKTFAEAMDDAFGEHAKKANDTFNGALANMKSALSRIGENFARPIYEGMIKPLNALREVFNEINKRLQLFTGKLTNGSWKTNPYGRFMTDLTLKMTYLIRQFKSSGSLNFINKFSKHLSNMAQIGSKLLFTDKPFFDVIIEFFEKSKKVTSEDLKLYPFLVSVFTSLKNVGTAVKNVFESISNVFKAVFKAFAQVFKIGDAANGLGSLSEILLNISESGKITEEEAENLVPPLVKMFTAIKDLLDKFLDFSKAASGKMGPAFSNIYENVLKLFDKLGELSTTVSDWAKNNEKVTDSVVEVSENLKDTTENASSFGDTILGIVEKFKKISPKQWGLIAGFAMMFAIFRDFKKISKSVVSISGTVSSILSIPVSFAKVFPALARFTKYLSVALIIKEIAISIGILAASIGLLSLADPDNLLNAAISLSIVIAAMAAFTTTMILLGKSNKHFIRFFITMLAVNDLLKTLAITVVTFAASMWIMSNIPVETIKAGLISLVALMITFTAVIIALSKLAPQISQGTIGLVFFAASIWTIADALDKMKEMNVKEIISKMGALMVGVLLMVAVSKIIESSLTVRDTAGLFFFIGVIYTVEETLKYIAEYGLDFKKLKDNIEKFIVIIIAMIALDLALTDLSTINTQGLIKAAATMVILVFCINLMVDTLNKIAKLPGGNLAKALATYIVLIYGIRLLITSLTDLNAFEGNIMKAGKTILKISVALAIISASIYLLSKIGNTEALMVSVAAIGAVLYMLIFTLQRLSTGTEGLKAGTILSLSILIASIGGALAALTKIDNVEKSILAAISISVVLGVLCLVIERLSIISVQMKQIAGINVLMTTLSLLIISVTASLAVLSSIDDQTKLLPAIGSLLVVLTAVVGAFIGISKALSTFGSMSVTFIAAFYGMIIMLVAIAFSISLLADITSSKSLLEPAIAISIVLIAVGGVLVALSLLSSKIRIPAIVAFGLAIASLLVIVMSLQMLLDGNYNWNDMEKAINSMLKVLGGVIIALGLLSIVTKLSGGIATILAAVSIVVVLIAISSAMKALAKSIKTVVQAVKQLASIDYDAINTDKLTEVVMVFAKLGLVMTVAGTGLLAVGLGLAAVGVGLAFIGASVVIIAAGISLIILSLAVLAISANKFISKLIIFGAMIPAIAIGIRMLGEAIKSMLSDIVTGLLEFLNALKENIYVICDAIVEVLKAIIIAVSDALGKLAGALVEGIAIFFEKLNEKLPDMLANIIETITVTLREFSKAAKEWGYYGMLIIGEFVAGMIYGLAAALPDLIDSVVLLSMSLVYAIRKTLDEYSDVLVSGLEKSYSKFSAKTLDILAFMAGDSDTALGTWLHNSADEMYANAEASQNDFNDRYQELLAKNAEGNTNVFFDKVNETMSETDTSDAEKTSKKKQEKIFNQPGVAEDSADNVTSSFLNRVGLNMNGMPSDISTDNFSLVGQNIDGSVAQGVEDNTDVIVKSVNGIPTDVVKKMTESGEWELSEDGKNLIKTLNTGVEEEANNTDILGSMSQYTDFFGIDGDFSGMMGEGALDSAGNWNTALVDTLNDPSQITKIFDATTAQGTAAKEGWDKSTDTASPSKEAIKRGDWWIKGLLMSLNDGNDDIEKASRENADSMMNVYSDTLSKVASMETVDANKMSPVITPVIDTSRMGMPADILSLFTNPATSRLATDSTLAIQNSQDMMIAQQLEAMRGDINRLADKDFSKILDGVAINVDANTTVDGTVLRKTASNYTIKQINQQEQAILMAKGARG